MVPLFAGALDGAIIGGAVGGLGGGLAVLLLALLTPRRKCPDCQTLLPRFRSPGGSRQALWGGWTCPACGCEVDRRGRKVEPRPGG
jgi:hypothetical protein